MFLRMREAVPPGRLLRKGEGSQVLPSDNWRAAFLLLAYRFFVFCFSDAFGEVALHTGAGLRLYVRVGFVIEGDPNDVVDGASKDAVGGAVYWAGAGVGCTVS